MATPQTISVALTQELYLRLEHAIAAESARAGATISKSAFLRRLVSHYLNDPTPLFDQGVLEGHRTGYAAIMHAVQTVAHILEVEATNGAVGVGYTAARGHVESVADQAHRAMLVHRGEEDPG